MKNTLLFLASALLASLSLAAHSADKPNILVVWGDDVGQTNISAYSMGMMGYRTPNIDRIAREGMIFTDYYGEQSCTAGRSSFIMGQSVFRTGLSKVGLPGAKEGMNEKDPTIAGLLKNHGYVTGQFGKNHLGDRDEHLPSNHGFDEFYGNLYHLNAEEEPENYDYPTDPAFRERFGPRGVIRSTADGKIEDTGPLTKKRMEVVDDDTAAEAIKFIEKAVADDKPFFVWWSGTRMHFRTHVSDEKMQWCREQYPRRGRDPYTCGMLEHDAHIGLFLDKLDELDIADNRPRDRSSNSIRDSIGPTTGAPIAAPDCTASPNAHRVTSSISAPSASSSSQPPRNACVIAAAPTPMNAVSVANR